MELIQRLRPLDRELVILYLEGLGAAEIGEVVGISPGNVSTRIKPHQDTPEPSRE